MRPKLKVKAARGAWTAQVDGRQLAVLQQKWWAPPHRYHDPMLGDASEGPRYTAMLDALQAQNQVVIQRDRGEGATPVTGYIGVFRFEELAIGADGSVSLKLVERTADAV